MIASLRVRLWQWLHDLSWLTNNDHLYVWTMKHMPPVCLCCNEPILDAFGGWCADCAYAVLADVITLRDSADLSVVVCVLRDAGAESLSKACVGVVPFDYSRMTQ